MKRLLNNSVALFVIVIILLLIIPMPPFVLDVMIIINISLSMIILLISMNIREPLEFSIFPSLLLITTLFRLGINVSSTRNILTKQGQAGQVIHSFGSFVLQGNVVVGFIIFFIIVLVQFIVITKGAERVAEVAARFTLDAMPGKQMAIDADLSSGLINEQEARIRRNKIQREADFYGAMDGATKIVKGDAIMALIITAVNLIGGFAIGILMSGMELSQALSVYSIATVGDGLVSQIPALLISTSTGMIVTRAVSEGSLNEDVSKQFLAQPRAIMMTGIVLLVLMLVPGMPKIQMAILAAVLIIGGYKLSQKIEENASLEQQTKEQTELSGAPVTEEEYYKDINNIYSLIEVEPIEMEFGYSLIPLVDESSGGKMINRIVIFRRQYAQDMGFVIPSVRLRDSSGLNTNQYIIKIRGEEVARGEILVDHYLALEPSNPSGVIDGIETIEPAYGIPSKWILPENKEMAEIYGYTVIDPLSVMITHLSETIKQHAYELLNRQEVNLLLENVKKAVPELVEEVIPGLMTFGSFQKILVNLLKEGIPIKGMETILETIANTSVPGEDTAKVTEKIRVALKRTITRRFCTGGQMRVVTLDAELEKNLVQCLSRGEQGTYLAVSPDIMQSILTQVGEEIKKFQEISQEVIILTSQVIRVYLYQMLEQFYPSVHVLAFNEIADNVQIQAIGNIKQE
ncbi:flagellar biosynthesis protein FlhA [Muricomes intestini]|jgi:flagellar biosynthesis protein FlhA|uniref:Flagellar biosynthesis protein FlhA n=1 Tax=Muricomes intestini TaxID=1796634 RepID=A0A4R3KHR8_9FIRM|nr:flagellar biosynthesis protein FlhA [Muricomes intestini]TCS82791.1 flagellar biosynthesis protein FlhA [Muricomes intestini]HAX51245.1 flagellar biosynthesis protein FlhA [Lachnospiraceae bacterium]HCR83302.1 flagellar biosynthesis protein FlhA [Lachnospiraceae bacterium]